MVSQLTGTLNSLRIGRAGSINFHPLYLSHFLQRRIRIDYHSNSVLACTTVNVVNDNRII